MSGPRGHCLCGGVRFAARGAPNWVAYCHCASCRRHTGSPVTAFVNYRLDDVTFSGDRQRATFASSEGVVRSFCPGCGTPMGYESGRRPGEIDLYINTLERPEDYPPTLHAFYAEHVGWLDIRDDLPRQLPEANDAD